MEITKLEVLKSIIDNQPITKQTIRTIHKLLQVLEINKKDLMTTMPKKEKELYALLKKHCEKIVADLYEMVINFPRQSQQFLALAKEQEQYYNAIFGESTESFIMPNVVIKRDKSKTSINVIDELK